MFPPRPLASGRLLHHPSHWRSQPDDAPVIFLAPSLHKRFSLLRSVSLLLQDKKAISSGRRKIRRTHTDLLTRKIKRIRGVGGSAVTPANCKINELQTKWIICNVNITQRRLLERPSDNYFLNFTFCASDRMMRNWERQSHKPENVQIACQTWALGAQLVVPSV